jgi:hypothetical protein
MASIALTDRDDFDRRRGAIVLAAALAADSVLSKRRTGYRPS